MIARKGQVISKDINSFTVVHTTHFFYLYVEDIYDLLISCTSFISYFRTKEIKFTMK